MNFIQLETFVTVVQLHSFSEAAKKLHFSQSTVTGHVGELERELNQQLLIRSTRDFQLTKAGMSCYSFAVAVVARKNALVSEYNKLRNVRKVLRIVASSLPSHYFLPKILSEFNKEYPDIFLKIIPSDSRTIVDSMTEHQAHIAFCGYEKKNKDFSYIPLKEDELVVITPKEEQFVGLDVEKAFPTELLIESPMVCRAPTSGTRIEFENYLKEKGIEQKLNIISEMPDVSSIINSVVEGLGIAVVSLNEVMQNANHINILHFSLEDNRKRYIYLVKKKYDELLPYEYDFYNFVLNKYGIS